jgi:hypothetical protein
MSTRVTRPWGGLESELGLYPDISGSSNERGRGV